MKFRLIFSALAIIVAVGMFMLKGGLSSSSVTPIAQSQTSTETQATPTPAPQDNGMSNFSINNRN
jgi:hypothetical protein